MSQNLFAKLDQVTSGDTITVTYKGSQHYYVCLDSNYIVLIDSSARNSDPDLICDTDNAAYIDTRDTEYNSVVIQLVNNPIVTINPPINF
jgi:hypothetical protein